MNKPSYIGSKVSVSNKDETDVPDQILSIACANMGADGTILIFLASFTAFVASIESEITGDFITEVVMRSTAGPDNTPCVM